MSDNYIKIWGNIMTNNIIEDVDKERLMNKKGKFFELAAQDLKTVCEVHREIYRKLKKDEKVNVEAIELLYLAYIMAKKMNNKLKQYKYNYDDFWL